MRSIIPLLLFTALSCAAAELPFDLDRKNPSDFLALDNDIGDLAVIAKLAESLKREDSRQTIVATICAFTAAWKACRSTWSSRSRSRSSNPTPMSTHNRPNGVGCQRPARREQ